MGSVEIEDMLEKEEVGEVTGGRFFSLSELFVEVAGVSRGAVRTGGAVGVPWVLSSPAGSIQYSDDSGKGGSSLGLMMNAARDREGDRKRELERRRWRCFECSLPMMGVEMGRGGQMVVVSVVPKIGSGRGRRNCGHLVLT